MTPRFYTWAIRLSWSLIGLDVALILGGIALGLVAPPAWAGVVTAITVLIALPVGLWSPVGLVFAHARSRGVARRIAAAGLVLTWTSVFLTFVVVTNGNTFTSPGLWGWLARASLPVMLFTLACALSALASMTPAAGPRAKRALTSGVAAMFTVAVVVSGMVIVDSGNRALFALLALLLAWAVVQAFVVLALRRRTAVR